MATGGTMVLEQAFDGITLVIFAAVISFFAPLEGVLQQVIYITAGLFLGAIAVCFVLALSPRLASTAIGLVLRLLPHGWRPRAEIWLVRLIEGLGIMRSPGKLALVFVLSVLVWACEAGMFYMVAFSFDLRLPFHAFMLATSVANLAWALVMSQGGLGSFDLAAQKTIELFNVGPALAASYVVVLHAFILLATIPVGFVFLWLENVSLARIVLGHDRSQQVREGEPPEEGKEKR